jgi:hypothetical protein
MVNLVLARHSQLVSTGQPLQKISPNASLESVADYTRRPLYTQSSGDLGTDAASVEKGLLDTLDLATHWNAIVLIDEADVFLEQRSHHDLQRNGLVSGRPKFLVALLLMLTFSSLLACT